MTALLGVAFACRHSGQPPEPSTPPPADTAPPCTTCGTPPETGSPPAPWPDWATTYDIPPLPDGIYLPPSVRVVGYPDSGLGTQTYVVPAAGGDLGLLFLSNGSALATDFGAPWAFILDGSVPRGEHRIHDVWDGVSGYDGPIDYGVAETGDVDGDGHYDVWLSRSLYLGPIMGHRWPNYSDTSGARAWVDEGADSWPTVRPLPGAYDADGDGELDIVMGYGEKASLYYGPLIGRFAAPWLADADPDITTFGEQWCGEEAAPRLLRDHLGPGRHAFSIGSCGDDPAAKLWELAQPRGTVVRFGQAVSTVSGNFLTAASDAGDVDGDGTGDAWCEEWCDNVLAGPPAPNFIDGRPLLNPTDGTLLAVLGDMNGDGVTELLGEVDDPDELFVLFSPHADPLLIGTGLLLSTSTPIYWGHVVGHADIDGDGKSDLVTRAVVDDLGDIRVWFGADLVAADAARRAAAGTP